MRIPVNLIAFAAFLSSMFFLASCASGPTVSSVDTSKLTADSRAALRDLYSNNSAARKLGQSAAAVLVFPHIAKGGFLIGGQGGNGALFYRSGGVGGYYQTAGISYGLQAGIQQFGYALFLMDNEAIRKLNVSDGWDIGSAPSLVVVDEGISKSLTAATAQDGIYAFFFNQKGLMGGIGLQGTKITRMKDPGQ